VTRNQPGSRWKRPFAAAAFLAIPLILAVGCGDNAFTLDPGHVERIPSNFNECFDGSTAELVRYSTVCARTSPKSLTTEIIDGFGFDAEEVSTLGSPCAGSPAPEIRVYFEGDSLVFDFSKVTHQGRFAATDFDGYIIDFALSERNALLLHAAVDFEASTLPLDSSDIEFERDHIAVNFEGLTYDEQSLARINFVFANISAMAGDHF
jgi:hypothetical protein